MPAPSSINDTDLFFGSLLLEVDWEEYFDSNFPGMPYWRKTYVRRISEESSINPLVLLSSIMVEEKNRTGDINNPETQLDSNIKEFAKSVIEEYYNHNGSNTFGYNNATFAVWKTYGEDKAKLAEFLVIYDMLKSKVKSTLDSMRSILEPIWSTENSEATRRSIEEGLVWPFPPEECWDLSK